MLDARRDHSLCAKEPLTRLGNIQGCGELLIVDATGLQVLASSPGLWRLLDSPEPAAGRIPAGLVAQIAQILPRLRLQSFPLDLDDWPGMECSGHASSDGYVIEWWRATEPTPVGLAAAVERLHTGLDVSGERLFAAAQRLAEGAADIAGYDRVLVYQFHPDWSGEVIAEVRRPEMTPFLGLRYPEGDIPAQARELYLHNTLRVVADADDVALPLRFSGEPPDLTQAFMRSASPVHLHYLRNMGVRSTLTISLVHNGRLWGLIACHHGTPRLPPAPVRRALHEAASAFSTLLSRADLGSARRSAEAILALRGLVENGGTATLQRLLLRHDGLAAMMGADGIAWVDATRVLAIGLAPDVATLRRLAAESDPAGAVTIAEKLGLSVSEQPRRTQPAGMLAAKLPQGWLALFRRELVQEIHWAGNPEQAIELTASGAPSPRKSFALWRQLVRGTCRPWSDEDQALLTAAIDAVIAAGPTEALAEDAFIAVKVFLGVDEGVLHSLAELLTPNATALMLTGAGEEARVLHMTPALARLLGASAVAIRGLTWEDAALMLGLAARAALTGSAGDPAVVPAFSPEHGPLLLRLRLETMMQIARGDAAQRFDVLLVEDETRSERLSMALRSAVLQTDQARRGRDAFLRNSSHELRTPLNAIIGFADLLADPKLPAVPMATVREYGQEILGAGRTLLELVEHLLQVSQIEVGRVVAHLQDFDLARLLHDQASLLAPLFARKSVRLELNVVASARWFSDPGLVRQAVVNMLGNALKFTPANGRVTCSLRLSEGMAEISIADTGPGVDPVDQARIFDAFEQGDTAATRQHGGAGLGLFIARNLIESLRGRLTLVSAHAAGSRFVIRLPAGPSQGS